MGCGLHVCIVCDWFYIFFFGVFYLRGMCLRIVKGGCNQLMVEFIEEYVCGGGYCGVWYFWFV